MDRTQLSERAMGTWLIAGVPARSPWRVLAATAAITEAVAHIPVIQEHLSEAPYIGVGFVLLTVAGLLLGQWLLVADTPAVWVSTLVVSALALMGYVLSRTVGLPQIRDDVGNWHEPLAIVAIVAEALMFVTAARHLRTHRANRYEPASGGHKAGLPLRWQARRTGP